MSTIEQSRAIAEQIARGFQTGQMADESLYAPDATTWHNVDETDIPHSQSRETMTLVRKVVPDFHAEDVHIHAWEDGFAMQYVFVGKANDGTSIRIPGCIIGTLKDGQIARIQEYVDSAHAAPLLAAMEKHAQTG